MMIPGEWSAVISVVAGGWSVRGVDVARLPGVVIGVNESGLLIPRADIIVSMDRLWTEGRWNVGPPSAPNWSLKRVAKPSWLRRSAVQNLPQRWPWLTVFECDHTSARFSDDRHRLNGSNSGMCALNLAWQMRPHVVYLFGYDLQRGPNGQPYWYPAYEWNQKGGTSSGRYREWRSHFDEAARQFAARGIKVYNCSDRSLLKAFDRIDPDKVLREAA